MAHVVVKRLVKKYGELQVVHGIDFEINNGEFVVLVGPSGCGKSTILRIIAGLETVTGCEIVIDDEVVNDVPPRERDIYAGDRFFLRGPDLRGMNAVHDHRLHAGRGNGLAETVHGVAMTRPMTRGFDEPQAPPPAVDQAPDGFRGESLVVEIVEGMRLAGFGPSLRDVEVALQQILDPAIVGAGVGEDQPIDAAGLHEVPYRLHGVRVGGVRHDNQMIGGLVEDARHAHDDAALEPVLVSFA